MSPYVHNYTRVGAEEMVYEQIPDVLGYADAKDEWRDKTKAASNFISIDSYNQFVNESCVFLVGRIGTGKTAMLNKLKYSIERGESLLYRAAVLMDTNNYIAQLGISMRSEQFANYTSAENEVILQGKWEFLINTMAMVNIYHRYYEIAPERIREIESFLSMQGLIQKRNIVSDVLNHIIGIFEKADNTIAKGIGATAHAVKQYFTSEYDNALRALDHILETEGQLLILIDSIEQYDFDDEVTLAVLNSLVSTCIEYSRSSRKIAVKMAAPSELIPKLRVINIEKISNKIVYIRWSQNDLRSMIAIRLYRHINQIIGEIKRDEAESFFMTYYDEYCQTFDGFNFQTFAYCSTYTQKKPRQIIAIFNAWLYLERKMPEKNRMELVRTALTYNELTRVRGALEIYNNIHPRMFEMFCKTFANRKYCFTNAEFDRWLKGCAGMRGLLEAHDLKRYFISSGLVGIQIELHYIPVGTKPFENITPIRIKEVLFEYQYKERLPFNNASKFCIHPMCFRVLQTEIDQNTFVYPMPLENEDEYVPW